MSKVDLPVSLSTTVWDKQKKDLEKDKSVMAKVQKELTELAKATKAVQDAHGAASFELLEAKGLATAAAASTALAKLDAAAAADFKKLAAAAKDALDAANDFQNALQKASKDLKGEIAKTVTAAIGAASTASKGAAKFVAELNAAVATARSQLDAEVTKLKNAAKGAPPAAAPVAKVNPKAGADAKMISALLKKTIAVLRTPKGSPVPVRFMILQENKKMRVYLGPKPENGLAKLKTQFDAKAKIKRIKDPKATVVWEKGFLTFLSDVLKAGLSKQIQLSIKEQTKLSVKVRVKRSDGAVDEAADAPDLTDDQLKIDAADEAEIIAAGKNFAKRLGELKPQIDEAMKGAGAKKVKALVDAINASGKAQKFADAVDGLDELESLLEEGDVSDGDDDDAPATGDKGVPPAKAFFAKLGALKSKIDAAVAAGGDTAKKLKAYAEEAERLAKKEVAEEVAKANRILNEVEQMLSAPAGPGGSPSVAKLAKARLEWISTRDTAIKEITQLSKEIVAAFAKEADQKSQVAAAIGMLGKIQVQLKSELDRDLDAALNAADGPARAKATAKAKASLQALRKFVEEDELMQNLDNNEIVKSMSVVAPMKKCLSAIEAALG